MFKSFRLKQSDHFQEGELDVKHDLMTDEVEKRMIQFENNIKGNIED